MQTENVRQDRVFVKRASRHYASALALVLMLLSMSACSAQARAPKAAGHATVTAAPAPTATPIPSLAFRRVTFPPGFNVQNGSIVVSPVDGQVAWACISLGSNAFNIWVTTNAGATWEVAGTLHPITPETVSMCGMTADQRDPQSAVFGVTWGGGEAGNLADMSFYTRDGGQHWAQLPGWIRTLSVETDGAVAYALINITTPPPTKQASTVHPSAASSRLAAPGPGAWYQNRSAFIVSNDGLQTWRELQVDDPANHDGAFQFWHSPTTDDLFAATYSGVLWHSADGGVR